MFFLFSKLLVFLITPLVWIIALFITGLLTKKEVRRKRCLGWSLGLLLFFSNNFIFDEFSRLWEVPATHYKDLKNYNAGIVLGGMVKYDKGYDRLQFYRGADRLLQAVELYKRGYIKKIVFTGGSGSVLQPDDKEGAYVKRYLLTLDIPQEDFYIENESQNTRQNALFTKKLIDSIQIQGPYLLITSGFHMRRSLGCFHKVGMVVDPYSTDRYAGPRKFEFDHLLIPNISALNDWHNLIHEMVGFITYKISGYA